MLKFILKRILLMIPILVAILVLVFTISYFMPGDPVLLQMPANYTQEQYDAKEAQLGLDKPYLVQLGTYLYKIFFKFDLGTSYISGQSVNNFIGSRIWVTFRIGLLSCFVTLGIAIPLGIIAAVRQYSVFDYFATTLAIFLAAMPGFWLALMLIILFSQKLGWLPASGLYTWKHYILPVLCNALAPLAQITRMTRSSMLEVIRQDYIRTARSKGLKEHTIIIRHALHNALIPIVTVASTQFAMIIGGSVIVENIFSIPGMGSALVTAIGNRDYPCIMGITFLISIFVCVINMLVDVLYSVIDPRIKAQIIGGKRKKKTAVARKEAVQR
jgi:peptide/nickel transport system permease protein